MKIEIAKGQASYRSVYSGRVIRYPVYYLTIDGKQVRGDQDGGAFTLRRYAKAAADRIAKAHKND